LAVALYLATYFHIDNISCKKYYQTYKEDLNFIHFLKLWSSYDKEKKDAVKETSWKARMKDFDEYVKISKTIENKDARKLQRFLELKKFFSIPWILAHETLFSKKDFLEYVNLKKTK
jgi:hypothetical protein